MNETERELDLMVATLEQENRELRARMTYEVTILTEMVRDLSAKIAQLEAS